MEIKRRVEKIVMTNRQYVIRQSPKSESSTCNVCNSAMLTVEKTAVLFDIKQRQIFQIIEENRIHFTESEKSVVMICLSSIVNIIDVWEAQKQSQLAKKAKDMD